MHIHNDKPMRKWLGETLQEMAEMEMATTVSRCQHCGYPNRYRHPVVARQSDIELFESMMRSAFEVMDRHGITANLLADIRAQCLISMANKNAAKENEYENND
jgi:hypothetical protein